MPSPKLMACSPVCQRTTAKARCPVQAQTTDGDDRCHVGDVGLETGHRQGLDAVACIVHHHASGDLALVAVQVRTDVRRRGRRARIHLDAGALDDVVAVAVDEHCHGDHVGTRVDLEVEGVGTHTHVAEVLVTVRIGVDHGEPDGVAVDHDLQDRVAFDALGLDRTGHDGCRRRAVVIVIVHRERLLALVTVCRTNRTGRRCGVRGEREDRERHGHEQEQPLHAITPFSPVSRGVDGQKPPMHTRVMHRPLGVNLTSY